MKLDEEEFGLDETTEPAAPEEAVPAAAEEKAPEAPAEEPPAPAPGTVRRGLARCTSAMPSRTRLTCGVKSGEDAPAPMLSAGRKPFPATSRVGFKPER